MIAFADLLDKAKHKTPTGKTKSTSRNVVPINGKLLSLMRSLYSENDFNTAEFYAKKTGVDTEQVYGQLHSLKYRALIFSCKKMAGSPRLYKITNLAMDAINKLNSKSDIYKQA
jgi:hypothetical protein